MKKKTFVIPLVLLIAGAASMLFMTLFTTPYGAIAAGALIGDGEKSENAQRKMIDIACSLDPNGCNIYYGADVYSPDYYITNPDKTVKIPDFAEKCVMYNKEYYELCKTGYEEDDGSAYLQDTTAGCQYVKALYFSGQTELSIIETEKLIASLKDINTFYGLGCFEKCKFTLKYMYNRSETDEEKQTVEELNGKLNEKFAEDYPELDILYESLNDVPVYDSYNGIKNYDDYDMVYEG